MGPPRYGLPDPRQANVRKIGLVGHRSFVRVKPLLEIPPGVSFGFRYTLGGVSGYPRAVRRRCRQRAGSLRLATVLHLYDTATGEVRELALREPGTVSMYVCGPTVYGPPHLGHGRATLVYDILRRYLEWTGPAGPSRLEHHRHRGQDHRAGRPVRAGRGRRSPPSARRSGGRRWTPWACCAPPTRPTPPTTSSRWWR